MIRQWLGDFVVFYPGDSIKKLKLPGEARPYEAGLTGRVLTLLLAALVILAAVTSSTVAATMDERLAPCLACHGEKGQSAIPETPSLGGQPQFYLSVQLYMFREKMRNIEPMPAMMKGISDDDLRRMAAAISNLPPPLPAPGRADPVRLERARALVEQHRCNFCHKENFSGEENAPRLAAQREDYLIKTMREYKNNARRAYDPSMADAMHPVTDADILDLAHYLARLR